jgi:hypothetical protein
MHQNGPESLSATSGSLGVGTALMTPAPSGMQSNPITGSHGEYQDGLEKARALWFKYGVDSIALKESFVTNYVIESFHLEMRIHRTGLCIAEIQKLCLL